MAWVVEVAADHFIFNTIHIQSNWSTVKITQWILFVFDQKVWVTEAKVRTSKWRTLCLWGQHVNKLWLRHSIFQNRALLLLPFQIPFLALERLESLLRQNLGHRNIWDLGGKLVLTVPKKHLVPNPCPSYRKKASVTACWTGVTTSNTCDTFSS